MIVRLVAWTLSIVVVAVVGAAGVSAAMRQPEPPAPPRTPRRAAASPVVATHDSTPPAAATPTVQLQGAPSVPAQVVTDSAPHAPATTVAVAAPAAIAQDSASKPAPLFGPIIPQGRTDLQDSLYAVRRGETVVVNFDTGPARTRRADKFESVVRQTLHVVYGPVADTLLAAVPSGKLVLASELVTTLPRRGIHFQGAHGPKLALWPVTRPGHNGLLVFAYRTVVER
ncbi:MAG TPA: hypothetical protein VGH98_06875 [Gemmatimonadaceae bacterium]